MPAPAAGTRGATAVRLYLEGYTCQEIADLLGYGGSGAVSRVVHGELARMAEADATTLRHLEYERLASMRDALRAKVEQGDVQAITAALKVSERMSRLMGLDKPGRLDIGAHKGSRAIEIVQINMPAGARPAEVIDVTPSPAAIAGEGGVDGESRDGRPGDIGLALREADGELRPADVSLEVREPGGAADPVPGSAPGREAP